MEEGEMDGNERMESGVSDSCWELGFGGLLLWLKYFICWERYGRNNFIYVISIYYFCYDNDNNNNNRFLWGFMMYLSFLIYGF